MFNCLCSSLVFVLHFPVLILNFQTSFNDRCIQSILERQLYAAFSTNWKLIRHNGSTVIIKMCPVCVPTFEIMPPPLAQTPKLQREGPFDFSHTSYSGTPHLYKEIAGPFLTPVHKEMPGLTTYEPHRQEAAAQ